MPFLGREAAIIQCPHTVSDDVYCIHQEDVVVACEGEGNSSGRGLEQNGQFIGDKRPFIMALSVSCLDSPSLVKGLHASPGTTFLVSCPSGCR